MNEVNEDIKEPADDGWDDDDGGGVWGDELDEPGWEEV